MTSRIDYNNPKQAAEGSLSLSYHYEMLSDQRRLAPFARAIEQLCPGKIVFESGTGSGILSILAAKAGATHVYCSEIDPKMAAIAQANFEATGCADRITLLHKSTLEVSLADTNGARPDVMMAENLSTWQVTEPENQVLNHLITNLSHSATVTIPAKATNYLELCQSSYRFMDLVELRAHYFEFSGIPTPTKRSVPVIFSSFDYAMRTATRIENELIIPVTSTGVVNSLRLTSPLAVSDEQSFDASDSLMPPVIVPLPFDIYVSGGESLLVKIAYETNTSWEQFHCEARLLLQ